jgi:hypothetical protein
MGFLMECADLSWEKRVEFCNHEMFGENIDGRPSGGQVNCIGNIGGKPNLKTTLSGATIIADKSTEVGLACSIAARSSVRGLNIT